MKMRRKGEPWDNSGGLSSTCHCRDLVSIQGQCVCDLCRRKSYLDRFSFKCLDFFPLSVIPHVLCGYLKDFYPYKLGHPSLKFFGCVHIKLEIRENILMVATLFWTKTVLIQVTYFSVIYYHTPFMGPKVGGNDIALTWKLAVLPFLAFLYRKLKSKFLWRPRMLSVHTKFSENRPNASEF